MHVIAHLLKGPLGVEEVKDVLFIQEKQSITKLLSSLHLDLQRSDLERIGIIVDADEDMAARWMALRNRLLNLADIEIDVPKKPPPNGTILTAHRLDKSIQLGIWLMPNNQLTGKLEDFLSYLIPADDTLWPRAKSCVKQIPTQDRRFGSSSIKAEIHTWLAWQQKPGLPLGLAVEARYFDTHAEQARKLVNWLQQLFNLST